MEPAIGQSGAYDALEVGTGGILAGESIYGFSVAFDWLGSDTPGSQYFQVINPDTFVAIDSGFTIPEPATVLLLAMGGLALCKSK